jgi:hypothetical protein
MTLVGKFIDTNNSPDAQKAVSNQKALITGANSEIGEGCAIALGAAAAMFVVNFVS